VPGAGEARWDYGSGPYPYIRWRITAIDHNRPTRCDNAGFPFPWERAIGIWLMLVVVESIHGISRRLLLEPQLGDLRARQVSVFTGAALITPVFWFTLKWLAPQLARRWWLLGLLWLTLTLTFEIGLGRATGMLWDRVAS
jgi:hypothetical protein